MKKRITIVDIAKQTGFSVSAVSKALADAPDISDETKDIIKNKCMELGYIQNISASALKNGNSRIIGIIYDSFLNPFYNEMIYYIELGLKEIGYTIIIFRCDRFDANELTNIVSRSAEGLISFLEPESDTIDMINKVSLPIVIAGRKSKYISSIHADENQVGVLAANYALDRNAKNPIYIGELKTLSIVQERRKGFEDTLNSHGVVTKSFCKDIYKSNLDFLKQIDTKEIVQSDFIFCFNDALAFDVISCLKRNHIAEKTVVGVDCVQREIHMPLAMASIGFDKQNASDLIIKELMVQIGNKQPKIKDIVVDVMLEKFN